MTRTISSILVKTAYEHYKKNKILFTYVLQRALQIWNKEQMSKLIHSIIQGYDIPALYFTKNYDDEAKKEMWTVLDGCQRLSTIFDFVENKYALAKDTPPVTLGKTTYEIAGKRFNKLPEEVREHFLMQSLDTKYLSDYTPEELEEQFYRLNNGTTFTKQQKAMVVLGGELVSKLQNIFNHKLWDKIDIKKAAVKKGGKIDIILRTFIFITGYDYGNSISATTLVKFADFLTENYTDEQITEAENLFDKLDRIIDDMTENLHAEGVEEFLTKLNVPTILHHLYEYTKREGEEIADGVVLNERRYAEFLRDFITDADENGYTENCGTKSSNRDKIDGRMNALNEFMRTFDEIDIENAREDAENYEDDESEEDYDAETAEHDNGDDEDNNEEFFDDDTDVVVSEERGEIREPGGVSQDEEYSEDYRNARCG